MGSSGFISATSESSGAVENWENDAAIVAAASTVFVDFHEEWTDGDDWVAMEAAVEDVERLKEELSDASDREERADLRTDLDYARDEVDIAGSDLLEWFEAVRTPLLRAQHPQPVISEVDALRKQLAAGFVPPAQPGVAVPQIPEFSPQPTPHESDHGVDARRRAARESRTLYGRILVAVGVVAACLPLPTPVRMLGGALAALGLALWWRAWRRRTALAERLKVASESEYEAAMRVHAAEEKEARLRWQESWDAARKHGAELVAERDRRHAKAVGAGKTAWEKRRVQLEEHLVVALEVAARGDLQDQLSTLCGRLSQLVAPVPIVGRLSVEGHSALRAVIALPLPDVLPEHVVAKTKAGKFKLKETTPKAYRDMLVDLGAGALMAVGVDLLEALPALDSVRLEGVTDHAEFAWQGEPVPCVSLDLQRSQVAPLQGTDGRPSKVITTLGAKLAVTEALLYKPLTRPRRKAGKLQLPFEFVQIGARHPGVCPVCEAEVPEAGRLDAHLFVRRKAYGEVWAVVHAACSPVVPLPTKKATKDTHGGSRFTLGVVP